MRLVQLQHRDGARHVAIVSEPRLEVLTGFASVYELAWAALGARRPLTSFAAAQPIEVSVNYDAVYRGDPEWHLLPPIDHPQEPSRCFITGTGLTHTTCAEKRRAMHSAAEQDNDSIRMYRWGVERGRPPAGMFGVSPEWFYKGTASILRPPGESLYMPSFAEDAGEEAEVAGIYLIDATGQPRRIGMAAGNEVADHTLESRNYLYLAASKLRLCSLGPELNLNVTFTAVSGQVKIERAGTPIWSASLATGEQNMCHSLKNIEHHHFKFPEHRRPGDVHIHFYGADAFSFGEGIRLADGDIIEIVFQDFGRPLRNTIRFEAEDQSLTTVLPV